MGVGGGGVGGGKGVVVRNVGHCLGGGGGLGGTAGRGGAFQQVKQQSKTASNRDE